MEENNFGVQIAYSASMKTSVQDDNYIILKNSNLPVFFRKKKVQTCSDGDMNKMPVHYSVRLFAGDFSVNSFTMCCHTEKDKLKPIKVYEEL